MVSVKPHVLIVDDEPMILDSVSDLLEFDYVVHKTNDPREALKILSDLSLPIKIVMSDQRMPGMFGHELLRQAKAIRPHAVRLLLTGYSDLEAVMYSVNVGEIFRYINKPWKSDKLLNVFRLATQLHDQMSELVGSVQPTHESHHVTPIQPVAQTAPVTLVTPENKPIEKPESILFVGYTDWVLNQIPQTVNQKFNLLRASTIDDAFKMLLEQRVSVIVSEINLPHCDGVDFLKAIKHQYPHIVTIILTDVVDAQVAIRAINELNVFKYLTMPLEMTDFEKVLEKAVETGLNYRVAPNTNLFHTANQAQPEKSNDTASSTLSNLRHRLRAAQESLVRNSR
ncbi:MAG: response regulator [Chlorobiales bacterium]|nr:response regulator [Chlorobiales bacterium]